MRTAIIANGELSDFDGAKKVLDQCDLVIAADGGARHCQAMGITPAVVIGDFDSLTAGDQKELEAAGVELIRRPTRKDETDLELALLHAKSVGATEVVVFGGLGARWDQSIANLLLPAHPHLQGLDITFTHGNQKIYTIQDQLRIKGKPGDTVSLLPLEGDVHGVKTFNLEYPLSDETLYFGTTRGLSNVLNENEAIISIRDGILLCILIEQ